MPTEAGKKKKREKQEKWTIIVYDAECIVVKSGEYSGKSILFSPKITKFSIFQMTHAVAQNICPT